MVPLSGAVALDDAVDLTASFSQTLWTVMRFRPRLIHVNNEPLCNCTARLAGKLPAVPPVRNDGPALLAPTES